MKKSILLVLALGMMAPVVWATDEGQDQDMDTLQSYSDVVNEAAAYDEDEYNTEREDAAEESGPNIAADSPYSFHSSRIAQILEEYRNDEDEEDLQQRYAAMHDDDGDEENASF